MHNLILSRHGGIVRILSNKHFWLVPVPAEYCLAQEADAIPETAANQEHENHQTEAHPSYQPLDEVRAIVIVINDVIDGAVGVMVS
jgi:hypothetical protein